MSLTHKVGFASVLLGPVKVSKKNPCNGMVRSQDLFWWKWLTGQAMAALNYKLNLRVMEQSGADQNGMGGVPTCLGAHNTIQICRKMHLDLTIPNSLI